MADPVSLPATDPTAAPIVRPELRQLEREFRECAERARRLLDGVDAASFAWKPAADRWSIGECLAHLDATGKAYGAYVDRKMEKARAAGLVARPGSFRYGVVERLVMWALEPPVRGLRVKAPSMVVPPADVAMEQVVPAFLALQETWIERLRRADELDGAAVRVAAAPSPMLKLSLAGALATMAAHQRRHLWQAEQVKATPGYPGASGE